MSLGVNRDYKTADRRARRVMRLHAGRMAKYERAGVARDEASRLAMCDLETGRICSDCAGAGTVTSGEGWRTCKKCKDGMTGEAL
jgi:hypothetical protein